MSPSLERPFHAATAVVGMDLHDLDATRRIEARMLERHPDGSLMARAGLSAARWVAAMAPHAQRILVLAGPGGNGGDGLHAAAHLAAWGRHVTVALAADPQDIPAHARLGLDAAVQAGVQWAPVDALPGCDLAIDALLGIGSLKPPRGMVMQALQSLASLGAPLLALDGPTGLHPVSGLPAGPWAVRAQATLAMLTLRPGLFTGAGREHAGCVWIDRLDDLSRRDPEPEWRVDVKPIGRLSGPDDHPSRWLHRRHGSHKASHGTVLVIGGARGMSGALKMAAAAAQGMGAGRTLVVPLDPQSWVDDPIHPEWIGCDRRELRRAGLLEHATVVCGCGGGSAVESVLPPVLERAQRLVLDADALNAIARHPSLRAMVRGRALAQRPTVITPHPLEAARLLGLTTDQVQQDRLGAARRLADELQVTVALKGSGTIITSPCTDPGPDERRPGPLTINTSGGPALATAGTGDVLAGAIGGLWSQSAGMTSVEPSRGSPPEPLAHRVAVAAVWLHGRAAETIPAHLPAQPAHLVQAMRDVTR